VIAERFGPCVPLTLCRSSLLSATDGAFRPVLELRLIGDSLTSLRQGYDGPPKQCDGGGFSEGGRPSPTRRKIESRV
jgi:hypothetical protein